MLYKHDSIEVIGGDVLSIFSYEKVWHSFTTPFQVIAMHVKLALWLVAIETLKT
jgi:hypothetical protein